MEKVGGEGLPSLFFADASRVGELPVLPGAVEGWRRMKHEPRVGRQAVDNENRRSGLARRSAGQGSARGAKAELAAP
jgi:hypothetical protein